MDHMAELAEIGARLEELSRALASGPAELVERRAAALASVIPSLERLRDSLRTTAPDHGAARQQLAAGLHGIRDRAALVRRMLAHGEQVRLGVVGILNLLYEAQAGSQYAADGAPRLPSVHRMLTEA